MPIKRSQPVPTGVKGIVRDGDRFLVRIDPVDPKTGKRSTHRRVFSTFSEAVAFKERGRAEEATPTRMRFGDYAERWAAVHSKAMAPSSRLYYANNLAHAVAAFGEFYIDAISPADVREWLHLARERYEAPTVAGWLRVLRQVLKAAVADQQVEWNAASDVTVSQRSRPKGRRGNSLSPREFVRFLDTVTTCGLSPDIARMLITLAWTGARKGEVMALRFDDFRDDELRIERSVWNRHEKATKTDDPRIVPIVPQVADVVAQQRQWLLCKQHPGLRSGLLFPADPAHAAGGATRRGVDELSWHRSMTALYKPLEKVVKAAGITPISLHSLRRTWENLLRAAGVDQMVRRAMSGWRSEDAQRIYATVNPGEMKEAAGVLVRYVEQAKERSAG